MARFLKIVAPVHVSAFRPGIDRQPPWAGKIAKTLQKSCKSGDWLVKQGNSNTAVTIVTKADMGKKYRHAP